MNPLTQDECREAFEAWAKARGFEPYFYSTTLPEYVNPRIRTAWESWQTAWNHRSPAHEEGGKGGDEQPVVMSAIEKTLDEYETECIRYGGTSHGNTDKLQAARKEVIRLIAIPKIKEKYVGSYVTGSPPASGMMEIMQKLANNGLIETPVFQPQPTKRESVAPNHQPSAHQSRQGG